MLKGQVRRTLSLEAVRSQARLLLDRLRGIGGGADEAAKRRSRGGELTSLPSYKAGQFGLAVNSSFSRID